MSGDARPGKLPIGWLAAAFGILAGAALLGILIGPADLGIGAVTAEFADRLPGVDVSSGLTEPQRAILWEIRLPRVVLGMLVGCMLALAGCAYQGVFRNPLADPYLLGVAAGAGLGATVAIVYGPSSGQALNTVVPLAAFAGALVGVLATYALGYTVRSGRTATTLILSGVAVAAFLTAMQTFVQQQNSDTLREVYSWILGRLSTVGWGEVRLILPYVIVSGAVLYLSRRLLDVLAVGDEEAGALGLNVSRIRLVVIIFASLGTAAAVAVSGLIAFVGIIVPHAIRLVTGTSYRRLIPLSMVLGGAFLVLADLMARTITSPAELPIGVVTAFFGAPFFVLVLRTAKGATS